MSLAKTEEIKIRVPTALKEAVKAVADGRFTSESEIVREAIIQYLQNRAPAALKESAPSSAASQATTKPTSYKKKLKPIPDQDTEQALDAVRPKKSKAA